jgi:HAE1 family hydrophobic/amphiphilic exporter-1
MMTDQRSETQRPDESGGLSGVAIARPVFTTMMMLGLVVLGVFSFLRLSIDQFPEIDVPVVSVQTVYPGASPETVEREVTRRLEEAFNPVQGVDTLTSVSLEGVSQVIIEFDLDRDAEEAAQDIRAKIDGIRRELPPDIDPPVVEKFDPSAQPILSLGLSSERLSVPELTTLADDVVRRRIEAVPGVGNVRIAGGLTREVRVFLDPRRMQALGVAASDVMSALRAQNQEIPAGRIERGNREELVRVVGRITSPDQFTQIIVANREGRPIRLGDVAEVRDATEDERSQALVDGDRAVSLDVQKVSGANTVAVADGVFEAIGELSASLGSGTTLRVVRDNSVMIRHSVEDVIVELVIGAILTVVVVMLFLNDWKATTITSLALPVSVISSFVLMNALGFTLNVLTLMALSLSIGILIDDAIVVIENIVRHRELGEEPMTAAARGTTEIFLAVMATTLSIVAVFVPVAFMGGIVGRFFFQFGLTVAWAVLVSLFVSFTLTPMLSAWWGVSPHQTGRRSVLTRLIQAFNRWFDRQADSYRQVVGWALRHRKTTLATAVVAFAGAVALFPLIGGGFAPETDDSEFAVTFETPEGSSLAYTRSKAEEVNARLRAMDDVLYTYTTVGAGATGTVTAGSTYVKLVPTGERDRSQAELMEVARERIAPLSGVTASIVITGGPGGGAKPLQVNVRGADVDELQRLSRAIADGMRNIPGIVDVETSLGESRPEYRIEVNRDLANELQLDIADIASTVRPLLAGQTATTWEDPSGEEREVVVQVAQAQRSSVEDLIALPIPTPRKTEAGAAVTVPLGQIARIDAGTSPGQIDRRNLERVGTVSATTTTATSLSQASASIREMVAGMDMPAGYSVSLAGETEQFEETAGFIIESILLAVILIFLILASQFESFTQPLAIMVSLPLSLVGVLLALFLTGDTLNMMSMIGVIMLMGLVTKNAILLVDNANERRAQGADRYTAIVEAGRVRLRPILMTTLATIFGMLPVALGLGEGGGFRAPMARAVIGGMITSTLLTLVVVPVAYSYFDDFEQWITGRRTAPEPARRPEGKPLPGLQPQPAHGE